VTVPLRAGWSTLPMRKRILVAGLLCLVLTVAGACAKSGGGNGVATVGTPGAPSPTPSLSQLEQALRYTRCMREHGVPMLDPDANGDMRGADGSKGAVDQATVTSAEQACRQYRPVDATLDGLRLEKAREYSRCMRRNGVADFPDPDANGDVHLPDEITDPDYDHAKAFCTDYVRSYSPHP
jgi:hypothetical protein